MGFDKLGLAPTIPHMTSQESVSRESVRRLRRRPPLVTQEEVARSMGMSRTTYVAWESGTDRLAWEYTEQDAWEAVERLKVEKRRAIAEDGGQRVG